jgi:cyclopropane-fatty-acyl-phospholipid synthase
MTISSSSAPSSITLPQSAPPAARAVFRLLKNLKHGTLDVFMPDGSATRFGHPVEGELRAVLNCAIGMCARRR